MPIRTKQTMATITMGLSALIGAPSGWLRALALMIDVRICSTVGRPMEPASELSSRLDCLCAPKHECAERGRPVCSCCSCIGRDSRLASLLGSPASGLIGAGQSTSTVQVCEWASACGAAARASAPDFCQNHTLAGTEQARVLHNIH